MKTKAVPAVLSIIATWAVLAAACQGGSTPGNATVEVASGRTPNASVTGSVTYRERLPLSNYLKMARRHCRRNHRSAHASCNTPR